MADQSLPNSDLLNATSLVLSPLCKICKEVLHIWNSIDLEDSKLGLGQVSFSLPSDSGYRIENNCFLCSQPSRILYIFNEERINGSIYASRGERLSLVPTDPSWRVERRYVKYFSRSEGMQWMGISQNYFPTSFERIKIPQKISCPPHILLGVVPKEGLVGLESFITMDSFTGSNQSLQVAAKWLKDCGDSHLMCQCEISSVADFLPTRLIDIGVEGSSAVPRLCHGKDIHPSSVYFTLSHCWGAVPPKLVLLRSNMQSLFEGIESCLLPNTFKDAFSVVQRLGGRYIWIDSLCIIQDSTDDWLIESAHMCNIYSSCYCNICATDAKEGNEGLFRDRMPLQVQQGWCNPIGGETSQIYCLFHPDKWLDEVEQSPLYSRAWAYQERFLSKRNLHFGQRQLYWECRQKQASEAFFKGFPTCVNLQNLKGTLFKILNSSSDQQSNDYPSARAIWEEIVYSYTKCDLTYAIDRLVALEGLAAAAHRSIGGNYLAGIWENHLPSGLGWVRKKGRISPVFSINPTEPKIFIAPSWSLASLNSEVRVFQKVHSENIEDLCQILETHVDLVSDNQFGQVYGGYLKIKGDLARVAYKDEKLSVLTNSGNALFQYNEGFVYWDYDDMTELERIDCLYILPVCRSRYDNRPRRVDGLILYLTGRRGWEFKRCGAFFFFESYIHSILESGYKAFRKFSEENKSSEGGLDNDGKFTITII